MPRLKILDSGRIMCEIYIKPYNTSLMKAVEFKIDTGADFSTISKDALYRLGYTSDWIDKNKKPSNRPISVASGEEIESYYIKLPIINIYGVEGVDYPFGILMDKKSELPKPSCRGCRYTEAKKLDYRLLLGNDILSCF
ncbi:MAG: retroviral-like aspartic protease family protein [Oscillospiraceae bacterium]|nr:retroviral-like aspartic protease family protein [Oscillospiraceae bacterium]